MATNPTDDIAQYVMERLSQNPEGIREAEFQPDHQKFLINTGVYSYPIERVWGLTGWKYRRTDLPQEPIVEEDGLTEWEGITNIEEGWVQSHTPPEPTSTQLPMNPSSAPPLEHTVSDELSVGPVGTYNVEDLFILRDKVSIAHLTHYEQRAVVETALLLADTIAEMQNKNVAPLDLMRSLHGNDFRFQLFRLKADFDEDHAEGETFTIWRVDAATGTLYCFWGTNERDKFELEHDWMRHIERVE